MPRPLVEPIPPELWRFIGICLLIMAGASAYMTFLGILDAMGAEQESFSAHAGAFVLGIAIWVMLFLLWTLAFKLVPMAGRLRLPALGVVIFTCTLILAMSTWLGAAGIAGSAAELYHLRQQLKAFEAVLDDRLSRVGRLASLPPVLTQTGHTYLVLAESERTKGSVTGVPGPGAVVHTLNRVGRELGGLATTIAAELGTAPLIASSARDELAAMREALDGKEAFKERLRTYALHASKARGLLASLEVDGAMASVRRVVLSLEDVAQNQAVSSRSAKLAIAQRAALEKLTAQLRASAASVGGLIDDIGGDTPLAVPNLDPITPTEAVLIHWRPFAPFWAAAIGLDFTALGVLLYLMIAQRKHELDGLEPLAPAPGAQTVDDLLLAAEALKQIAATELTMGKPLPAPRRGRPPKSEGT